jgi:hypothetical protein
VILQHIGEIIQPREKCLILTDSLSSVKALLSRKISHRTHPLCSDLLEDEVEVNEIVDERARHAALNGAVFDRPLPPIDFQGLARSGLLREWQGKWDAADTGRFAHSILSKVFLRPWFDGQREDRKFVSTVSRIMSGHCAARSHLSRFGSAEEAMYVSLGDYETVNQLIWHCGRFETEVPSNQCTSCTGCAAWDSCPGFVCLEEVTGVEVLSGFPWKSWN